MGDQLDQADAEEARRVREQQILTTTNFRDEDFPESAEVVGNDGDHVGFVKWAQGRSIIVHNDKSTYNIPFHVVEGVVGNRVRLNVSGHDGRTNYLD